MTAAAIELPAIQEALGIHDGGYTIDAAMLRPTFRDIDHDVHTLPAAVLRSSSWQVRTRNGIVHAASDRTQQAWVSWH